MKSPPQSIAEATSLLHRGDVLPRQLLDFYLTRIDALDDRVLAWTYLDRDGALAQAAQIEVAMRHGQTLGPLAGIPIGIKDIVDVEGMPTRAGSPLTSDDIARHDAPVVARLRSAGAVILGKLATTEWAFLDPAPTRNPWNLRHTPGGSSAGAAAAVAAGMCLAAIGSQTGGSIVRPAAYCGVAGFKPTYGVVSTDGVVPLAPSLDHVGPIGRTVGDLQALWQVISEATDRGDVRTDAMASDAQQTLPPRLALVETFFMQNADRAVRASVRSALGILQQAGATITDAVLPESFAEVHAMHGRILAWEAARYHRLMFEMHPTQFGPNVARLIQEGLALLRAAYDEALLHQARFQQHLTECFTDIDALVMPATETTAPASLDTTGNPWFNSPWSYAGIPVVSLPCSLADDGLPVALQLVGLAHDEASLLQVGHWCEEQLAFRQQPAL